MPIPYSMAAVYRTYYYYTTMRVIIHIGVRTVVRGGGWIHNASTGSAHRGVYTNIFDIDKVYTNIIWILQ